MKVTLPEHIGDITLGQFQDYAKLLKREELTNLEFNKRKIRIFTGIPKQTINKIQQSDYKEILDQIDEALNIDSPFESTFPINGFDFGFIPNLDEITTAEFADLSRYGEAIEDLHKTMAVLFRPIVRRVKDVYEIETYQGTKEYSEVMKLMPLSVANGALGFFCRLAKELRIHIQKSTAEVVAQVKEQEQRITLASGDGTPLS